MSIRVVETELLGTTIRTRMPFRYGIATLTEVPHLVVRLSAEIDGKVHVGYAADNLAPKWFTKDPEQSYEDERKSMLDVINSAKTIGEHIGTFDTVFDWWRELYSRQKQWGTERGIPALLWNFGATLIERAAIDACCRAAGMPFARVVKTNKLGMDLAELHPDFAAIGLEDIIAREPLQTVALRHTIGLTDPLADDEIPADEILHDGLPQSLQQCISFYNLKYFKIKISGSVDADLDRLRRIARIIVRERKNDYYFTLDGNEQFTQISTLYDFWDQLHKDPVLKDFFSRMIVLEQPFHRDISLSDDIAKDLLAWNDRPPMIIDESDSTFESLRRALECGYSGTSHKNCKGIFKSFFNAALLESHRRAHPGHDVIMTAEDLTSIGPISLNQDLAMVSLLGIDHVERNGHHYFNGIGFFNEQLQKQTVEAHGDLYESKSGITRLQINNGFLRIASVVNAPFGCNLDPDLSGLSRFD